MKWFKTGVATIALYSLLTPALAEGSCATKAQITAFKISMVKQQFMVAALTCNDVDAYNRFVILNRNELQQSDADLKDFFVNRGGEHGEFDYDAFKTKLANISALKDAKNSNAYCSNVKNEFQTAFTNAGALADFVNTKTLPFEMAEVCVAPVLEASNPAPMKSASKATISVVGVPDYEMPVSPYGTLDAVPAPEDLAPPPPPLPAYLAYASHYPYAPYYYRRWYPAPHPYGE